MQGSHSSTPAAPLSPGERSVFLKHMVCRLLLGLWAIYSVIFESFERAVVNFLILACLYGMGEIVFSSLLGMARLRERRERERLAREAAEAARQARKAEQANYFDAA